MIQFCYSARLKRSREHPQHALVSCLDAYLTSKPRRTTNWISGRQKHHLWPIVVLNNMLLCVLCTMNNYMACIQSIIRWIAFLIALKKAICFTVVAEYSLTSRVSAFTSYIKCLLMFAYSL